MQSFDYERIRADFLKGPRLNSLLPHFENIAAGRSQAPHKEVLAAPVFLEQRSEYKEYHNIFQRNIGQFYKHLCASIPFFVEEQCRLGIALYKLAQHRLSNKEAPFTYHETSSADGTNARTLAEYAQGLVRTLTDSPNPANGENFHRLCQHHYSDIHIGPPTDITPEYLAERNEHSYFKDGFDVIFENTTFQMYGPNRKAQIAYIKRILKENGLIVFCEKIMHPNYDEYQRREEIKDRFKRIYFTQSEIVQKHSQILEEMERCQVTLNSLVDAIHCHFKYAYMIWNSTNFYEVVASNDHASLQYFLSYLGQGYVPEPFLCEKSPIRPLL
ncbi:MAG: hypothetical protein F6J87_29485 [Spirulina sp. SIO3F2]|nr:hypothetical protein [Spirulina sp. SIO3F2]